MVIKSLYYFQHANEDVERMLLGNKCDMEDKRVVPKAKGEQVRWGTLPASCKQPAHHYSLVFSLIRREPALVEQQLAVFTLHKGLRLLQHLSDSDSQTSSY